MQLPTERRCTNLEVGKRSRMKQVDRCFLCGKKGREFLCEKLNQVAASGSFRASPWPSVLPLIELELDRGEFDSYMVHCFQYHPGPQS